MKLKRHWAYFRYVIKHKWFVFIASFKANASLWRIVLHDLSKFRFSEWFPYAETFYKPNGEKQYTPTEAFNRAWLFHQHRNKHHYQYWILKKDDGTSVCLDMPYKYIKEMVADWAGAGRAITGYWEVKDYYDKHKKQILLSDKTREEVEILLRRF